ncbi:CAAX amino protease [Lentibacillus populi]|uniref:CAAX amino protease n=1 Tax=Lentibacillus populi TaxID=1827502 RepID=A0A9W5TVI7_9BACI|nr:type II CAAX endopeptidase family protein [Lentibacillus populi]GGB33717.1 CAAX amino protease [Lentibacillus populi]
MVSQRELIKRMSDRELTKQLMLSQLFLFILSLVLSFILFNNMAQWFQYFRLDGHELLVYGVIPGLIIVTVDVILMAVLPEHYYDDGGINDKIFKNRSVGSIFIVVLVIAFAEELLFRGVLQTAFGYVTASTIFALVHIRYLKKPVLLLSVLFVSFYLGFLFERTGNLLTTMTAHFIVDFLSGLIIRLSKKRC